MYIDRILFPIETLGPGNRIVVWTRGCSKHCRNCANPELWSVSGCRHTSVSDAAQIIKNICAEDSVDGITFTGGDPLEQFDELIELLTLIKPLLNDILVYTGFTMDEITALYTADKIAAFKNLASVLIDGPYVDELNDSASALKGSTNQRLIYFDPMVEDKYEHYLLDGRKVQNVMMGNKFISVGIHNKRGTKL